MTRRVLIANRGEIAVRVARAVRELGYEPVGIYTAVDKQSLHLRYMVKNVEVSSYLDIDSILEAAEKAGAEAIHPGYGFLSENPEFAERVRNSGIVFIGPSPEAMRLAGDKARAKEAARRAGIPTLPWRLVEKPEHIQEFAEEHGYPLLLKAVGGGGGMGIRVIGSGDDVEELFEQARKEAENAFKDKRLYVEPYLVNPKHIEVQILSDGSSVVHLYERDCSVQRRHQKIIEEAPAPILGKKEREEITRDAVRLMEEIGYTSAGTVEMLYDPVRRRHYFMEINARLQVEHPVTEMITGVDIVKEQINIAFDGEMSISQRDIGIHGHAIEARIYAENPITMMPSPGRVMAYREPGGPGIRVDSGIDRGVLVPGQYNPLVSKVIAWGNTRPEALRRLERALSEYIITGIATNIPLLRAIIMHKEFRSGVHTTGFLKERHGDIMASMEEFLRIHIVAIATVTYKAGDSLRKAIMTTYQYSMSDGMDRRIQSLKRRAWFYWSMLRSRTQRSPRRRQ